MRKGETLSGCRRAVSNARHDALRRGSLAATQGLSSSRVQKTPSWVPALLAWVEGKGFMRLITYLFAAALLWAVATSGPASSTTSTVPAQPEPAPAPPGARVSAYPR
jgi:hypothetical protein